MFRPEWDTQAQVTSALSVLRDQIPSTSSPRTLGKQQEAVHRYRHLGLTPTAALSSWDTGQGSSAGQLGKYSSHKFKQ